MLNAPTPIETLINVNRVVDVPTIYTIVRHMDDLNARIDAGVAAFNIAGGKETANLVAEVRAAMTASTRISRLLLLAVKPMSRSLPRSKLALMR